MPLVPITSPPVHATPGVATEHTSTTPKSFEEIPPTLVLQMDDVFARLQPVLPALVASDTSKYACARGRLWLTEKCLAFLPESESHLKCGFQVDYPSIALHAIARSVPEGLRSQSALEACLYCQLDDHPERDEEDDEEGDVHELWFAVRDAEALDRLYESLSYCASLHPSIGGSHPLGGLFGLDQDNDEEEVEEGDSIGRHQSLDAASTPAIEGGQMPKGPNVVEATNTLMFVNLPAAFFASEQLVDLLHGVIRSYGTLVEWTPLPAFGRSVAVLASAAEAAAVKHALDRVSLLHDDDESTRDACVSTSLTDGRSLLRVYFARETPLALLPSGEYAVARMLDGSQQYLRPPKPENEFLISPPGSPPVGWESRPEEEPNTATLAEDLIEALQKIAHPTAPVAPDAPSAPTMLVEPSGEMVPGVMIHASDEASAPTEHDAAHAIQPTARPP